MALSGEDVTGTATTMFCFRYLGIGFSDGSINSGAIANRSPSEALLCRAGKGSTGTFVKNVTPHHEVKTNPCLYTYESQISQPKEDKIVKDELFLLTTLAG